MVGIQEGCVVNLKALILKRIISVLSGFDIIAYQKSVEMELRLSLEKQKKLQKKRKESLIKDLLSNQYYGSFCNNSEWGELPIQTKSDILKNKELIISNPKKLKLNQILTSGSSGVKGVTYLSNKELMINRSLQLLWWEWAGYSVGARTIQLGVGIKRSLIKRAKDFFLNITYVPILGKSQQDISKVLKELNEKYNYFIGGYSSSLIMMAMASKNEKVKLRTSGVVSWGDKLFDNYRVTLENEFGAKCRNTYGSSEGLNIAAECEFGRMHIMTNHVYVEVVDSENNLLPDGNLGFCVVTRLDSRIFPFVRYKLGDLIRKGNEKKECECGRIGEYIEEIVGRDTDIIYFPGGFITVQVAVFLLKQIDGINNWQIRYKNNEFIDVCLLIDSEVKDHTNLLGKVENSFNEYINYKVDISVSVVDQITNSASGKPALFIKVP
jgi:phenylacetate-CoA ligase